MSARTRLHFTSHRDPSQRLPLIIALFCLIFVLDSIVPRGYSVPTLYLLPLILTYWLANRYAPVSGAAAMTALTLTGLWFSPSGNISAAYFNRSLAILAAWLLAFVMIHLRQRLERLELEDIVAQRTAELVRANASLQTQVATLAATEKTLRETRDRLDLVVSATRTGIWDWDLRTNRIYYSPLWKQSMGFEEHEISDSPSEWDTRLHPEDRTRALTLVEQFLSGKTPTYRLEHRLRHKNGSYRWILTDATLLRDELGIPIRMTGSHVDITDQKHAEAALRESEERYHGVITALAEGVVVLDTTGTIVACNPSAGQILGLPSDRLMGRSSLDPEWRTVHEDGSPFPGESHPVMITLRTGLPQSNVIMGVGKPDGQLTWISINTEPLLREKSTRPYGVVASFRDITAWKEAEQRLRQQEHEFRILVDNVPGFFSYVDRNYRYRFVNKQYESFFGLPAEQILGREVTDLIGRENFAHAKPYLDAALAGRNVSFEYQMGPTHESARWMKVSYVPDITLQGNTQGVFALVTDVTASKQAEQALLASEQRFRALFEQAGVGAAQIDSTTGRFVRINRKYCDIVGYDQAEMQQLTFHHITYPDDLNAHLLRMQELIAGEIRGFSMEKRYVHKNGAVVWVDLTVSPLWAPGEPPLYHIAVVQDITARKEAETLLKRRQAHGVLRSQALEHLLATKDVEKMVRELFALVANDLGVDMLWHYLVEPNGSALRLHSSAGLPPGLQAQFQVLPIGSGLCGQTAETRHPVIASHLQDPNNCCRCLVAETGAKSYAGFPLVIDHQLLGTLAFGSRTHEELAPDDLSLMQAIAQYVAIAIHRLNQERALRERHGLVTSIMNQIVDAVFLKDREGRYVLINEAGTRIVGKPPEELIGKDDREIFSPETARAIMEGDRRVMEAGTICTYEEVGTVGNVERVFLSTKDAYRDSDGNIIGVIGVSRDITERKRVEAELHAANERYRDLSRRLIDIQEEERRAIAHDLHDELGQLLTAVKLELSGIRKKLRARPASADTNALLPRVQSAVQLIDQAMDASRHAAMGLRPTHLDDLGLLAAIQWLAKDLETRSGMLCDVVALPDQAAAGLDETVSTGLFRMAQELLTNVARHAQASEVHVSLLIADQLFILQVEDNGIGIREDSQQGRKGLGLRGVRERASLLNGDFTIRALPGCGTVATVRIPIVSQAASTASDRSSTPELQP